MRAPLVRRLAAGAALLAVIAAGLAVHVLLPDTAGTDIAGDALYAVAAYSGLVMLFAWSPLPAGLVAAGWCTAVELFQLTGIPAAAGAAFAPATLVLGTVFDARDLVVYVAAVAAAAGVDAAVRAIPSRRTSRPPKRHRPVTGPDLPSPESGRTMEP
jgi:hypothetical protein